MAHRNRADDRRVMSVALQTNSVDVKDVLCRQVEGLASFAADTDARPCRGCHAGHDRSDERHAHAVGSLELHGGITLAPDEVKYAADRQKGYNWRRPA